MGYGGVGKKIGSNVSASLLDIFKNIPIFGPGKSTEQAYVRAMSDAKSLFGSGEYMNKISNAQEEVTADILKHGKKLGIKDDGMESFGTSIGNGTAAEKYGMDEDAMNSIQERSKWIGQAENRVSNVAMNAAAGPMNIAKNYMLEGSPLRMYAKGAIPYVGYQMATGQRESLTQKDGQRDIAGIPFV